MPSEDAKQIEEFFSHPPFAIVGASTDRQKCGNVLLRLFLERGMDVFPVHPSEGAIEGVVCYPNLTEAPRHAGAIAIVTPPSSSEDVLHEAGKLGIDHVWFEPGAASDEALAEADRLELNVIHGGLSLLDALRDRPTRG